MARKLGRNEFPAGHGPNDFKCFGPAATKDGEFAGTNICDMGCFMQEDVDSNKYYHGANVQSTKNNRYYFYTEYARVGAKSPSFQFVECDSLAEAQKEYCAQLKSKNIDRGRWEKHITLGDRLVPKIGSDGKPKDLYIVRPQATRSTGLPDARTITCTDGIDTSKLKKPDKKSSKPKVVVDKETTNLMRDLSVATTTFAKASMADSALPTQSAIDKARPILIEATKLIASIGPNVDDQVANKDLKLLTRDIYSLIPKVKPLRARPEDWLLNQDNIFLWQTDLDAFESALYVTDLGEIEDNPLGDLPLHMEWLSPTSEIGKAIHEWMPRASRNVHRGVGDMKVKNVWKVDRHGDDELLRQHQDYVAKQDTTRAEIPLHQPKRIDLSPEEHKRYVQTKTHILFHGTRSVNVSGILRESLRMPKQLVGVVITGAMFGPGNYWADDWRKSAGYTSLHGSYWSSGAGGIKGRGAFMFLTDVCLGKPFVAPGPKGYTSAPAGYHSVMGAAGRSSVANNEFITYERRSHRLRYLVEFTT